jgi:hypothetical protein
MRKSFAFRDEAVGLITGMGFRYCNTLGWYGWWNLETRQRAIVDFNSASKKKCWAVTTWKVGADKLPPKSAHWTVHRAP